MKIKITVFLWLFIVNFSLAIINNNLMFAQTNNQSKPNNRVFKITDIGYQFHLPTSTVVSNEIINKADNNNDFREANLIKVVNIYTKNNFIIAKRNNSFGMPPDYDDNVNRGFPELMIKIYSNGSKKFLEEHSYFTTEPRLRRQNLHKTYQGIKYSGGKKIYTYLTADEWGEYEIYMFVAEGNQLVFMLRHTSPFQGNKNIFEQIVRTFQKIKY